MTELKPQAARLTTRSNGAALLVNREQWSAQAACTGLKAADVDRMFFGEDTRAAKRVCKGCPVRQECRGYAERTGQAYGVWGGRNREVA